MTQINRTLEIDSTVAKSSSTPGSKESANFETALRELERLVERMERGDQTLDESLKDFERGMELAKACQSTLKKAEQRVEKLVEQNGEFTVKVFSPEE